MEDREERRSGGGRGRGQSREEGDEVSLSLGGECVEPSLPASGFVGRHGVGLSNKCLCSCEMWNFDKQKTEVGRWGGGVSNFLSQVESVRGIEALTAKLCARR